MVQVYTGDGKGKTTAALGLALRASGQGLRVGVLQFMKGNPRCGEHRFLERFPAFALFQPAGSTVFGQSTEQRRLQSQHSLELTRTLITEGKYDLLILDEVLTALSRGLISVEQLLALVRGKPVDLELVLTGRGAPPEIIEAADLVTEMVKVKHPLERGIKARRGLEF